MGCSIIREGLAAFHSETKEKIGRFAEWCICDIYYLRQHRENGATSVYIYIYRERERER